MPFLNLANAHVNEKKHIEERHVKSSTLLFLSSVLATHDSGLLSRFSADELEPMHSTRSAIPISGPD